MALQTSELESQVQEKVEENQGLADQLNATEAELEHSKQQLSNQEQQICDLQEKVVC